MKIEKLASSLLIEKQIKPSGESPLIKPDFHQFIFILSGQGTYTTQNNRTTFCSGDIFLIRKDEEHSFSFDKESIVYTIKFQESTRRKLKEASTSLKGLSVPPQKAKSPINLKASISSVDLESVQLLFDFIVHLSKEQSINEQLIYLQMISLVSIMERNLSYVPAMKQRMLKKDDIKSILKHIQKNLKDPAKLSLKNIAAEFNMSVTKLSSLFKKETGLTVKNFVDSSRMTVIEGQVKNSDASFSEIAFEYGFSDESHLNKTFKKHFGKSPSDWRRGK